MDYLFSLFLMFVAVVYHGCTVATAESAAPEYCEGETFTASCTSNSVIVMTWARYGRMSLGRCIQTDYGQIGCQVDVTSLMDSKCSGRQQCEVRVSSIVDDIGDGEHRCSTDLRSYLQAEYTCIPVATTVDGLCPVSGQAVLNATDTAGHISSLTLTEGSSLGTIECPWLLEALPGQRINLTMYDFGLMKYMQGRSSSINSNRRDLPPEICHVYISIKERRTGTGDTVCAGAHRVSTVYTSLTNSIEIRVVSPRNNNMFLLQYQAIDCPTPPAPQGGTIERVNTELAVVRCNNSDYVDRMYCRQDKWTKSMEALTCRGTNIATANRISADTSVHNKLWEFISGTQELSILIIVCVAMIIGCSILTMGLVCLRKKRLHNARRRLVHASGPRGGASIVSVYQAAPQKDSRADLLQAQAYTAATSGGGGTTPNSSDPYGGQTQNDYYRTWQLRNPAGAPGNGSSRSGGSGYGPVPVTLPRVHSLPHNNRQHDSAGAPPYNSSQHPSHYPHHHGAYARGSTGEAPAVGMRSTSGGYSREDLYNEHIYESPKFERRDGGQQHQQQYYELDPSCVEQNATATAGAGAPGGGALGGGASAGGSNR